MSWGHHSADHIAAPYALPRAGFADLPGEVLAVLPREARGEYLAAYRRARRLAVMDTLQQMSVQQMGAPAVAEGAGARQD